MSHRVVTFVPRDAKHLAGGGVDHRRVERVVPGGGAEAGVVGVLSGAGYEADAISTLVRPRHGCGFARPGLFKRQVTPAPRVPGLVSYDSAASHTDPYLRGIALGRENAVAAVGR